MLRAMRAMAVLALPFLCGCTPPSARWTKWAAWDGWATASLVRDGHAARPDLQQDWQLLRGEGWSMGLPASFRQGWSKDVPAGYRQASAAGLAAAVGGGGVAAEVVRQHQPCDPERYQPLHDTVPTVVELELVAALAAGALFYQVGVDGGHTRAKRASGEAIDIYGQERMLSLVRFVNRYGYPGKHAEAVVKRVLEDPLLRLVATWIGATKFAWSGLYFGPESIFSAESMTGNAWALRRQIPLVVARTRVGQTPAIALDLANYNQPAFGVERHLFIAADSCYVLSCYAAPPATATAAELQAWMNKAQAEPPVDDTCNAILGTFRLDNGPPPTPAQDTVFLRLLVRPAGTDYTATIDGQAVVLGRELQRGTSVHVTVKADGHRPYENDVRVDRDTSLHIDLAKPPRVTPPALPQ
jgi:hypothetical protein